MTDINQDIATTKWFLPKDYELLWDMESEFSQKTFGTDKERGPIGPLKHLVKEVQETLENPKNKFEYADCILLIFDAARRSGLTYHDLLSACFQKLEINKKRDWPKPVDNNSFVEHIKS